MQPAKDEELLATSRFRVVRRQHSTDAGQVHSREVVLHPGAVAILPLLADGRICLLRNYRLAVQATLIELPAGTLEPGEAPAETARRELAEETGYRAERLESLGRLLMSPGILHEVMHVFVATGLTPGAQDLQPGEQIELLNVTWSEALEMVRTGVIQDAKTVAGLLFYDSFCRGRVNPNPSA